MTLTTRDVSECNQRVTNILSAGFFKNVFANLKKGSYLIRIKKKPIKSQTTSLDDKIVVTASTKHKFEYKQQTVCILSTIFSRLAV